VATDLPAIVDSHVHLWDPARFRMPWLDALPSLNARYEIDEFRSASAGLTVEGIVYVQVDVTPAYGLLEARWASAQPVSAVVAYAPVEDGAVARSYLEELNKIPKVKGVRRLIQDEREVDFPLRLIDGVRLLPEYALSFDICVRHHQMAATVEMVRACPETRFVLDHIGKPDIKAQLLDPWREHLAALAALPNVMCKLSGLVTEADHERWTIEDLRPYAEHVLASFGDDRVMFGGDWPVATLASSYRRWVETLRELTPHASEKLWAENARSFYDL
jgi:L-fuconolactonase